MHDHSGNGPRSRFGLDQHLQRRLEDLGQHLRRAMQAGTRASRTMADFRREERLD
jgi:hypothetical protein